MNFSHAVTTFSEQPKRVTKISYHGQQLVTPMEKATTKLTMKTVAVRIGMKM